METLQGKPFVGGHGKGRAMVTRMPMNFTAAHTKPANLVPGWLSRVHDRHHDLYKKKIKGAVLVFPACIGSTYTGMVLLELMYRRTGPAAIIVQEADSLLVSGQMHFGHSFPALVHPVNE